MTAIRHTRMADPWHQRDCVKQPTLRLVPVNGNSLKFPRNNGRAVTRMMDSQSVHLTVPGGVSIVGAGRRSLTIK